MASKDTGSLRVAHLYLDNWRNFVQVDLTLRRRVFVVGPSAAGKTNLLDALRFLHDIALAGGGLQAAVAARGGLSTVRCLAARGRPEVSIGVTLHAEDAGRVWSYELGFAHAGPRRVAISHERVVGGDEVLLDRPTEDDRRDPERLSQTHLEQLSVNQPFRALAELFASMRYLNVVPQLMREPARSVGLRDDPFGGDFLQRLARTPQRTQESRLSRIQQALQPAMPHLQALDLVRDDDGAAHLRSNYAHWRPKGAWHNEHQLSDGTLRLVALLWAVLDGTGPLLIEEPERSLHPQIVRDIPQLITRLRRRNKRQIWLSTHSPDLLQTTPAIDPQDVHLLIPGREGTTVRAAANLQEANRLLRGGLDGSTIATQDEIDRQMALFESPRDD